MKTLILLMLLTLAHALNAQTVRVMPLGNSITQGDNSHYSYRYNLWGKLNNLGLGVVYDFVGSVNTNFNGSPAFPNPSFDRDHEGHWGWRADQLLGSLPGWLINYTPDIVLLHAGSNDAFNAQSTSSTVAELEQIIDVVRADNSNVTILLAKLIPVNSTANANINALNAEIPGIVSRKNTTASRVILVDQNTGFNASTDTYDGVHPNSLGEEKMAQKWFDAIMALAPPANSPPVVANAIIDQSASVGAAFSYTFPANTFTDPDAGTTLTYTSILDNGTPLPGWLSFTGSTRTFSGTPAAANVGPLNIRVTASDGAAGGTVSDVFTLTVNPATKVTPLITWANPAPIIVGTPLSSTQLNATATHNGTPVAGIFSYTPASGTVLGLGSGQLLSVSFAPTDVTLYNTANKTVTINVNSATPTSSFYRALNLNGPALTIDGNSWIASVGAPNFTYTTNGSPFSNQAVTLIPSTDATRATMIRSSIYGKTVSFAVGGVPAGSYQVWLYVWEDNFPQTYSLSLEGSLAQANINSGSAGTWNKLGPYPVTINDGVINISSTGGDANFSGIEIWTAGQSQQSAVSRFANQTERTQIEEIEMLEAQELKASPNPFSERLNVIFLAKKSGDTRLELFDLHGKRVRLLYEGSLLEGEKIERQFDSDELGDGIYILQLVNGKLITRLKLIRVR